MSLDESNQAAIIQEKWSRGIGVHANGITFSDGKVILCECRKVKQGGETWPTASPIGASSLASILEHNDDPWVELTETDRVENHESGIILSCGEGAMGNEGYVAVSALGTGELKWLAFFACSNPFVSVRWQNDCVLAENTYEQEWKFPLDHPERISISASG